ncbi:MAG: hypothetical protein HY316_01585 [Acidobacteria bacterium]|nr:hypothetical protein [Acidobacteriota bacterium]
MLLTGDGGDQWLAGSNYHSADLLRRFRLFQAVRRSRDDSRILGGLDRHASPLRMLLRFGAFPLLPIAMQRGVRRLWKGCQTEVPLWIGPALARRAGLMERRARTPMNGSAMPTVALREDIRGRMDFSWYSLIDRNVAQFGLEYRHPFLDRRVIEYCLGLPHEQLRRGDQTKFVLRQAMDGILPQSVRTRRTKARLGSPSYWQAMESLGGAAFLQSSQIAALGWVDGRQVAEMYRQTAAHYERNDEKYIQYLWPLWMICGIELWYRIVFSGEAATALWRTQDLRESRSKKDFRCETQKAEAYSSAKAS